jgi:hypothetical protein
LARDAVNAARETANLSRDVSIPARDSADPATDFPELSLSSPRAAGKKRKNQLRGCEKVVKNIAKTRPLEL